MKVAILIKRDCDIKAAANRTKSVKLTDEGYLNCITIMYFSLNICITEANKIGFGCDFNFRYKRR